MSVSFYPTMQDTLTRIACCCGAQVDDTLYVSHSEAYNAFYVGGTATLPVCGDEFCAVYPQASFVQVEETPEVNVSNVNAEEILDVLGIQVGESFSDRCAGSMNAEAFLGRVLMADAVQPVDAGLPAVQEGNMVYMGRHEGYMNERVTQLREVAEYAVKHNVQVVWS